MHAIHNKYFQDLHTKASITVSTYFFFSLLQYVLHVGMLTVLTGRGI